MKRSGKKIKNIIVFFLFLFVSFTICESAIADDTYALNVSVYPEGSGSVTKSPDKDSYSYGENVTLTAVANTWYSFRNWSGDVSSTEPNSTTIVMDSDMSVIANFDAFADDETEPTISGYIPEVGSIQVPRDTIIQVRITDEIIAGTSGLALETVNITVEGVLVYDGDVATYDSDLGTCRRVEITKDSDYLFVFQPSALFDYEQQVDVVVHAKDLNGNSVEKSYYFHNVMRSFGRNIKVNSDTGTLVQNNPATAMDDDGNIWVVWDQKTAAGDTDIYIGKLPPDGGAFETSVPVISDPNNQRNPAIAIDSSNVLYVVWEEDTGTNWDILLLTSTDGKTWTGKPSKVNADLAPGTPDPVTQNPAIAIAINITTGSTTTDYIYVTWEEKRDGNKEIWVNKGDIGSSVVWEGTTRVTNHPQDQTEPAIALDLAGTAYIVWTDERGTSTDIYGADSLSGNWENKVVVATSAGESSPAIATESSGTVLHLLWVDEDTDSNGTIFYGATTEGLQELLEADIRDVVDEPDYPQSAPAIAVDGAREIANVFACWQDERNVADPDIYYAEKKTGSGDFGTNILVNDDVGANMQTTPAICIDKDGDPYTGWVDDRLGNDDIYAAASTEIGPALAEILVDAKDGDTVEVDDTREGIVDNKDDVIIEIPAGALPADTNITIAELLNPPSLPPGGFGVPYEFGPSGLVFNKQVTITIPHPKGLNHPVDPTVYWYDPSISPPASPWTQEGISDVQHLTSLDGLPSGVHAIQFNTTHFTAFGAGGSAVSGGGGGGGGGGCDISPAGQGNVIEYMLPYVFLTVVWVIIKRKDANYRRIV